MSEIRVNNLSNESSTGGPTISGITTFSGTNFFVPPVGNTAQRPENPEKGSLRFNTDSKHLEYFRGDTIGWVDVEASNEELNGGYRGIAFGGNNGDKYTDIEYFTISTLGNALDFGNLAVKRCGAGACASRTRGIVATGQEGPSGLTADIDYITISSTGDSTDFGGDVTDDRDFPAGLSSQTRGIFACGRITVPGTAGNVIDYITMASGGDAKDFGDTRNTTLYYPMCLASSTRGIIASGYASVTTDIDFITISTTGNGANFGDLSDNNGGVGASNSTRGLFAGGYSPSICNVITYITIATKGNSADFGDLTSNTRGFASATSKTRACFMGGKTPANSNVIQYVEILTTGNATDFGDLAQSNSGQKGNVAGCSNGHGGL